MSPHPPGHRPIQPVARKLTQYIFVYATLCALFIGALQAFHSWQTTREEFERAIKDIGLTHVPLLSVSIWDIEPEVIQRQLNQLADRSEVGYVRLRVTTGQIFEAGADHHPVNMGRHVFEIYQPNQQIIIIGYLEVTADPRVLYRQLLFSTGISLAGYGVLTLMNCFLVSTVLKRKLEQPLRYVADFVRHLEPSRLGVSLQLPRPKGHQRDEIDLVVEGFDYLQKTLSHHIGSLDQQVLERTRDLEKALASIRELSMLDALTGCYNRRLFDERIVQEMGRAERHGRALSLIFADVDHFKQINDRYGHLVGDQVLRAFSASLRQALRSNIDWVARYGGEEFLLVLPETDSEGALRLAERIRHAVAMEPIVVEGQEVRMTASFGVAQRLSGEPLSDWVDRADGYLYEAKQNGRNRVVG